MKDNFFPIKNFESKKNLNELETRRKGIITKPREKFKDFKNQIRD